MTGLLRRSHWGTINVMHTGIETPPYDDIQKYIQREGWHGFVTSTEEQLFASLQDACSRSSCALDDVNAVVMRLDLAQLSQSSQSVAVMLYALLNLRVKGLYHGIVMCAAVRPERSPPCGQVCCVRWPSLFTPCRPTPPYPITPHPITPHHTTRGTMAWALRELQLHQHAERQGVPRAAMDRDRRTIGANPAAAQVPHRARTRTHPCPFCYARKQDIPAFAFW